MYPDWLTSDLDFPTGAVSEQLAAATSLVPTDLLAEHEEELAKLAESQYFHFWMEALQNIGIWAEKDGLDDRLPVEFWVRVANAAHDMEFPEFVPYCLGKAKRLPRQDPGDLVAAFSTLPAVVQVDGALRSACVEAADLLRAQDPVASELLAAVDLEGIATHLRAGAYEAIGTGHQPAGVRCVR